MTTDLHPRNARLLERIRAVEAEHGRLPMPDMASWDIFPFEGDIRVRLVDDPVVPEPPRSGEGGGPCFACDDGATRAIWADDRWMLLPQKQTPFPIVLLEPRAHLDSTDLDDAMAAEMGLLTLRLERALMGLGGVGRVHVMKIGDGSAHLHLWFFARPEGLLQVRGSSVSDWSDALPVMPDDEWLALQREIAAALATGGGESLA
jgi:hypothetical protein